MKTYDIPSNINKEIEEFGGKIKNFRDGEVNPVQFKGIRVGHGVYEQRKDDTYMFRIRCAGGVITPKQLQAVSELSLNYGSEHFHVTTRQDVQLHYVELENAPEVYEKLIASGLSPRGGGGNTFRNIMASIDSGVSQDEEFDVLPYAVALTSRMIEETDSWNLPRKFKTAFSNSAADNCEATITCLGFIAKHQDGQKGFAVYIGGGMGAKPIAGKCLYDFIPHSEVYSLTKAIKIMFDKNGNRRKRFQAKIKFLVDKLGIEEFRKKVEHEWEIIKKENPAPLDLDKYDVQHVANVSKDLAIEKVNSPDYELWLKRYVRAQKQEGLYTIKVPLHLGDIDNEDGIALGKLLAHFGDNTIRLAFNQNLHIINIPREYLGNIFNGLSKLHTLSTQPIMISNMIACTGAATCRLGLCLPRGVLPETAHRLIHTDVDLDSLPDFKIHVSGCPNTCGRHHSADLGFFGKVGRKEKVSYPAYNVLAGAVIEHDASFAKKVGEVPAKDVPALIEDVLRYWIDHKTNYDSFKAFIDTDGKEILGTMCKKYKEVVPAITENDQYYYDWGSDKQFSILHGQQAECSAGVFDMIDVDIRDIRKTIKDFPEIDSIDLQSESAYHLVATSARMLLVTRDIDVKSDEHAFIMFDTHFIEANLIDEKFRVLIDLAKEDKKIALLENQELLFELGEAMQELYKSMDDSLRFPQLNKA
jgi:sulfite reductase (ferredoxin)